MESGEQQEKKSGKRGAREEEQRKESPSKHQGKPSYNSSFQSSYCFWFKWVGIEIWEISRPWIFFGWKIIMESRILDLWSKIKTTLKWFTSSYIWLWTPPASRCPNMVKMVMGQSEAANKSTTVELSCAKQGRNINKGITLEPQNYTALHILPKYHSWSTK